MMLALLVLSVGSLFVLHVSSANIIDGSITYVDTNVDSVQRRVASTCTAGSAIRAISNTGAVACEADNSTSVYVTGTYEVSCYNGCGNGSNVTVWHKPAGIAGSMCFLVGVRVRDVDGSDEDAACAVLEEGNDWGVVALSEPGDDADAVCGMRCLYWYNN